MRRELIRPLARGFGLTVLLVLGAPAQAIEWGNLFGGGGKEDKPVAAQSEDVGCPDVQILDGTAGLRVPAAFLAIKPLTSAKSTITLASNWDMNTNDPFFGRLYSPDLKKDDAVLGKFAAAANECFGDIIANIK